MFHFQNEERKKAKLILKNNTFLINNDYIQLLDHSLFLKPITSIIFVFQQNVFQVTILIQVLKNYMQSLAELVKHKKSLSSFCEQKKINLPVCPEKNWSKFRKRGNSIKITRNYLLPNEPRNSKLSTTVVCLDGH